MLATQMPWSVGEKCAMMILSQEAANDHLDQDPEIIQRLKLQKQMILAQAEFKKFHGSQVTPHQSKENNSATVIRSFFAILSRFSNEGALMPRSIRLKKSTEISKTSANCSCVILRSARI